MVRHCLEAAEQLAEGGTQVEVIDCRTLVPLDEDTIFKSVTNTAMPYAPAAEADLLPNPESITAAVRDVIA